MFTSYLYTKCTWKSVQDFSRAPDQRYDKNPSCYRQVQKMCSKNYVDRYRYWPITVFQIYN